MSSAEFIQTKLEARTNAMTSEREAKNNRWHYDLIFDESIGFDWIERQVEKAAGETETALELYKFGPSNSFVKVEVREVHRRKDIDDSQYGLTEFE